MRVLLRGRHIEDLIEYLEPFDFELVESGPDLVICYGGDGSLLGAERELPGVPKCAIRDSRTSRKCALHHESKLLTMLQDGRLATQSLAKIQGTSNDGTVSGLNDVLVNKSHIHSAVRYRLWIDDEPYGHEIVGDGLVMSTPFGSTGYYRSITRSMFRLGIGVAFNNSTEPLDHLVVSEDAEIRVQITRGPAVLLADNGPERIPLEQGDVAIIRRAPVEATVLGLDTFRCRECYRLRYMTAPSA